MIPTLWQHEKLGSVDDPRSAASRQLQYWRRTLAGLPERLDVPADRPRPATPSHRGGTTTVTVEASTHRAVLELAREHNASLFMVLHTALVVLLHRMTATDDVVVGTAIAGRTEEHLDRLIGMFVNSLVLRTRVTSDRSFGELLDAVRDNDLNAFANADLPFEWLVEALNPTRSIAHHPLFQVMLSLHSGIPDVRLPHLDVDVVEVDTGTARFDLQLTVTERRTAEHAPAGLDLCLTYAADLFYPATGARICRRFAHLLRAAVAAPASVVGDLDLLLVDEAVTLPAVRGPEAGTVLTLPGLFAAAAAVDPHRPAVRCDGVDMTYDELERRGNQLARVLIGLGAGPETCVALGLPRSADAVVAMLAIAKSGAAFVPIDPAYPARRKALMSSDSAAMTGLTLSAHRDSLPRGVDWLLLDDPVFASQVTAMPSQAVTDDERGRPLRLAIPPTSSTPPGRRGCRRA